LSDGSGPAGGPQKGSARRPRPRQTAQLTLFLLAIIAPAIWLFYSRVWVPRLHQSEWWARGHLIVPDGWTSIALCLMTGFGVALLLAIGTLNRHRPRLMFRPTGTKLAAMGLFGMLAPVGLFYALPIGGWSILLWLFNPIRLVDAGRLLQVPGSTTALLVASYAAVSMIIYGIRNYAVRGLLLGALWLSLYAAQILLSGVYNGPL